MSGHIPLPLSNYTPYTPIYQQNFVIEADCLCLSGVLASGNQGLVSSSEPTESQLQSYRGSRGWSESKSFIRARQ
jgi:hypothetical protein